MTLKPEMYQHKRKKNENIYFFLVRSCFMLLHKMKFIKGKKSFLLHFFCIISNSAITRFTKNGDKDYSRWRFRTTTLYTQCCYGLCTRVWSCETFSVVVVTINIWMDVNWRIRNGKRDVFCLERMFVVAVGWNLRQADIHGTRQRVRLTQVFF